MISLYCISINYKKSEIGIRKKLAFTESDQLNMAKKICSLGNADQCVTLCTCNRTEVYFSGSAAACRDVRGILAAESGIDHEQLLPHIMQFGSDSAMLHLFRVASGIDSMVIGEDEILGQTKKAYFSAKENGTTGYELNMAFGSAIACAKKIKTCTALSKTSVSMATLAANEAARLGSSVNVLLIGATGTIGSTVLKNLVSHKNVKVTAALRQGALALEACGAEIVTYSDRYRYADKADCIISATTSPHFTITSHGLCESLKTAKKRLLIDLAVPPDIDSAAADLSGIKLIGVDYFEQLAAENNALKLDSVDAANVIISNEIETLKKELAFHEFLPHIDAAIDAVKSGSFEKLLYRFKSELSAEQFSAVLKIIAEYGAGALL